MKHIVFDCDGTLLDTSRPAYKLYPGIEELITELSMQNLLYVWTARDRASTLRVLDTLGIAHFFQSFSTYNDAPPKPHIGGLQTLLGGLSKSSICVIGDSAQDMLGAKNFGVMALGAIWNKVTDAQFLKGAGADFIVSHPFECSKLIELNLKGDNHV